MKENPVCSSAQKEKKKYKTTKPQKKSNRIHPKKNIKEHSSMSSLVRLPKQSKYLVFHQTLGQVMQSLC